MQNLGIKHWSPSYTDQCRILGSSIDLHLIQINAESRDQSLISILYRSMQNLGINHWSPSYTVQCRISGSIIDLHLIQINAESSLISILYRSMQNLGIKHWSPSYTDQCRISGSSIDLHLIQINLITLQYPAMVVPCRDILYYLIEWLILKFESVHIGYRYQAFKINNTSKKNCDLCTYPICFFLDEGECWTSLDGSSVCSPSWL